MGAKLYFRDRKFTPLFWTQFLGALNDNVFKNALVILITYKGVSVWGLAPNSVVALSGGIFILPFLLFSPLAGQLSDRFEKSKIARMVKWLEVLVMIAASFGFYLHEYSFLMVALFLMGVHSTLFGPVKYSIIPELLPESQLTAGNASIEVGTFIAILVGTILGGVAAASASSEFTVSAVILVVAVLGLLVSYFIPQVPIADPLLKIHPNPLSQIWATMKIPRSNKVVFNSILAISWFWFLGAGILSVLPPIGRDLLHTNEKVVTAFLATFTIGIALGAFLCEKLSFQRVEIGLVPWGSVGLSVFLADLGWTISQWSFQASFVPLDFTTFLAQPGAARILGDLFFLSVAGGLFTVPLYTLIQERSERKIRSRMIASNNIYNALFMVVSSVMLMNLYALHLTIPQILWVYAALNASVAIYIYTVVPEFTLRFLGWAISRVMYRIQVSGVENIPKTGAAVLICNHVSFVDWLIVSSAIQRPIRFVIYYKFAQTPLLRYLFRHAKVIPIASAQEDKKIFDEAFETVARELKAGELVGIFPEGALTPDGELKSFKRGVEHVVARTPVPVIPIALQGLWGSIFSRKGGDKISSKIYRGFWYRVGVRIGSPVPAQSVSAKTLEENIKSLLT